MKREELTHDDGLLESLLSALQGLDSECHAKALPHAGKYWRSQQLVRQGCALAWAQHEGIRLVLAGAGYDSRGQIKMTVKILIGDSLAMLKTLPDESVHCCVTSPPYFGLRDYGIEGQMGSEATPAAFIEAMTGVFREVRRVLRDDGTCWVNMGDSYASGPKDRTEAQASAATGLQGGLKTQFQSKRQQNKIVGSLKPKDLMGMPWRLAFALQDDGWYLRQDIIWSKPNPMPESVRDRCTKAHEYIFLLSKSERYFYDQAAIAEPVVKGAAGSEFHTGKTGVHQLGRASTSSRGVPPRHAQYESSDQSGLDSFISGETRNKRSVWQVATQPFAEAHFATFPPELPETCIKAGCPEGGTVLDPFFGAGTTGLVADRLQRNCIGIELNPEYAEMARRRIYGDAPLFSEVE